MKRVVTAVAMALSSLSIGLCLNIATPAVMRAQTVTTEPSDAGASVTAASVTAASVTAASVTAATASDATAGYLVELSAPSGVEYFLQQQRGAEVSAAAVTALTQQHIVSLDQMQRAYATLIEGAGAPILFRTQRVHNGIAVLATPTQAAGFAALPGVKAVHRLVHKSPDTAVSVPLIGAPALWKGFAEVLPVRGEGIRIAVIDTGVDYLHADFGGPAAGYGENDTTQIGDVVGFPGAKVIGGYDFAGDHYNADARSASYNPIPAPDADPMDCYGHGTHVAGIAAGFGVTQARTPYPGPWDASVDFAALRIGPGVAPLASVYALKVFGCTGASDLVDLAIEWAVDPDGDGDFADHVDVINLSLGSPLGELLDPTTVAANRAAALGVIVVASAGNAYDSRFVLGSPSNGARVVSVAASQHGVAMLDNGALQRLEAIATFSSRGPRTGDAALKPDLAAPGVSIVSAASNTGADALTLSGTSMAAPHVAGALALLRQLHPAWSAAEIKALAMNTAFPLVRSGSALTSTLYAPSRTGAGRLDLVAAARAQAIAFAPSAPGSVSLSFGMPDVYGEFTAVQQLRIANKGSVPVTYTASYFAVTDMPGVTVTLPTQQVTAPAGGGADLLVTLSAHAAAMGRATPPGASGVIASGRPWFDEESGHVLLWPAAAHWHAALTDVTATAGAAVHAVQAELTATYSPATGALAYTLTLTDIAPSDVTTLTIGVGRPGETMAPLYTLHADGGSPAWPLTGEVMLAPTYALLLAANGLSVELTLAGAPVSSMSGPLATDAAILRVPLYAAPRPVAVMAAAPPIIDLDTAEMTAFTLTGQALSGITPPTDTIALASIFQLALESPNQRPANLANDAADLYDAADISHVGIAVERPAQAEAEAILHFAVATHAAWATPNQVRVEVLLDIDADGAPDFRLFNSSREGFVSDYFLADGFVSVLEELRTLRRVVQAPLNSAPPAAVDTRPFQSRVMVLPVRLADLGLTPARGVFSYTVRSYYRARGLQPADVVDTTAPRHFDLAHPALTVNAGGAPLLRATPGVLVNVHLDRLGYAQQRPHGLLILHHHNPIDAQVETIEIRFRWPHTIFLPQITR